MSEPEIPERGITREDVFRGKIVNVRVDTVVLPDGRTTQREVVDHPGAVAVIARDADGRLLLVRQFRYAVGASSLELPAGCLDRAGEGLEAAARRELAEETGHSAGDWTYLGRFHSSPGILAETMHLWLAEALTPGAPSPEDDEFVTVETVTLPEALEYVRLGRIHDAKTIVGLLWLAQFGGTTGQTLPPTSDITASELG
ncbi:MAG: NUDIX hydrolase [Candidatus Sericytochromatia bacterium]|nr:NUDIX hydrolase [Candidatus Sericytochromatia bacterium]